MSASVQEAVAQYRRFAAMRYTNTLYFTSNVCFSVYKRSTKFISLCRNFDLAINQCSVSNNNNKKKKKKKKKNECHSNIIVDKLQGCRIVSKVAGC